MYFSRSIVCFVLSLVIVTVMAQKPTVGSDAALEKLQPTLDKVPVPINFERLQPGEKDGDAAMDLEFDMEITKDDTSPNTLPTADQARRVYESQIDRVSMEAKRAGDDALTSSDTEVTINPVFQYYSLEYWRNPLNQRCCPRSWNYQCRSSDVRLPCFSHYYGGAREWCCPIWPSVFIKRCLCSQCAVLTSTCANEGRCQRSYSRKSFLAVCYRNYQWGYLRYITRYLPSSCYCRI